MQKITPFLWFNNNAEEAINFYTSLFNNSKLISTSRYPEGGPMPAGTLMVGAFQLEGQHFMAMNAGPGHPFTDSISLYVDCKTQEEVDKLWNKLTADGGEESQCGWCKDKYGLSWQIIPAVLIERIQDKDREKAQRVMQAMFTMRKIDIAAIEAAYKG